jgi:hypothetical protein
VHAPAIGHRTEASTSMQPPNAEVSRPLSLHSGPDIRPVHEKALALHRSNIPQLGPYSALRINAQTKTERKKISHHRKLTIATLERSDSLVLLQVQTPKSTGLHISNLGGPPGELPAPLGVSLATAVGTSAGAAGRERAYEPAK